MRTFVTECKEVEFSARRLQTSRDLTKAGRCERIAREGSREGYDGSTKG